MDCPHEGCNSDLIEEVGLGEMVTLVGYSSPLGHNHDDNCRTRAYRCGAGHVSVISKRNRCSFPGCGWRGKEECFCHSGSKVDEWPEEEARRLAAAAITARRED